VVIDRTIMGESTENNTRAWATRLAELAREEDLGTGDLTSQLCKMRGDGAFELVARGNGVVAGCVIANDILQVYDRGLALHWSENIADGSRITSTGAILGRVSGNRAALLAAERVLLNFLGRLCGIATSTRQFVDAVAGTSVKILDTRKTTPGWRALEKYAVRCGGGGNHRMGLYDAVLMKDNHLAGVSTDRLAACVFDALNELTDLDRRPTFVEVEADSLDQVEALLRIVGIDVILLDNFSLDELEAAVALRESMGASKSIALEASGGITLTTVRTVADTGVDRISVGAITHSATVMDLAFDACEGSSATPNESPTSQ